MKNYLRNLSKVQLLFMCIAVVASVLSLFGVIDTEYSFSSLAIAPIAMTDLNLKTDGLQGEQLKFMQNIQQSMLDVINKAFAGTIGRDDLQVEFDKIADKFKGYDDTAFLQLKNDYTGLMDQVKEMAAQVEKYKQAGVPTEFINKFDEGLNEMLNSDDYNNYLNSNGKKSGKFTLDLKGITSMTDNYEGRVQISRQLNKVVSSVNNQRVHMRDVISVEQGDPQFPVLSWSKIYDLDRNARYVTENGLLPESSFKVKEESSETKRLGTTLFVSKRMLKSRVYIRSYIMSHLPEMLQMNEDYGILFGDGTGENLNGLVNETGVVSVEDIINAELIKGVAGDVLSVSSHNEGKDTKIEFAKPFDAIVTGMKITFAGATTHTDLNAASELIKINDRQILLKDVPYKDEGENVSALTFKVNNASFKDAIEPNSGDVVDYAFAVMAFAEYYPNFIALNPSKVASIKTEKDTTGHNLGLITENNGVKYIGGRPIVELKCIPHGKYFLGDGRNGASLVDYTSLTIEFAEDVTTKRKNSIAIIAQQEEILACYMPWAFAYGDFNALKEAITKA